VEPSEVEDAIKQHPTVARSAVTAGRDGGGRDRLVAHVVASDTGSAPTLAELRGFLAPRLPAYMLPTRVVALDRLPTTPSGKIDRRALPVPDGDPLTRQAGRSRSRNALEEAVTRLWGRALGLELAKVNDDFFEAGGDSLAAMRVVAELERETGVRLPPSVLVEAPTPERLAKLVARSRVTHQPSDLVALRSAGTRRPFFCVAPATGRVVALRRLASRLDPERPIYALQSFDLDDDPGGASVESVAARYVAAIRKVQPAGPYLLGGQCRGAVIALEAAQQLRASGEQVPMLVVLDGPPPRFQIGGRPKPSEPRKPKRPSVAEGGPRRPKRGKPIRRVTKAFRGGLKRLRRRRRRAWRRTLPLRRALAAWLEPPFGGPGVRHFYRQRKRLNEAKRSYIAEVYPGRICLVSKDPRARGVPAWEPGWRALAGGGMDRLIVPARHHDVLREPAVAEVAEHVDRCLDAAETAIGRPAAGS
jgi:thioesterase domain-containing protein/acyl carrier protein